MPVPPDPAPTSALTYVVCFDSGPRGGPEAPGQVLGLFVVISVIIKVGPFPRFWVKAGDDMIHSAASPRLPARLARKSR